MIHSENVHLGHIESAYQAILTSVGLDSLTTTHVVGEEGQSMSNQGPGMYLANTSIRCGVVSLLVSLAA